MEAELVETFVAEAQAAPDADAVQAALSKALHRAGLSLHGYVRISGAVSRSSLLLTDYCDPWVLRYRRAGHIHIDPVIQRARTAGQPFVWGEDEADLGYAALTPCQRAFMEEARGHGLVKGLTVPVVGLTGPTHVAALSFPLPAGVAGLQDIRCSLVGLHLITLHFHAQLARTVPTEEEPAPALSLRERECLTWTARGKTRHDIAAIIGLSPRTVVFHIENARAKLGSANIAHAVATAIRLGLIPD